MFRIFYHAPCADGITSAFAASIYLERSGKDPCDPILVSWHPMKVFLSPDEQFDVSCVSASDEIFVLDYSGSLAFLRSLSDRAAQVTVLDHHLTAILQFNGATNLPSNLRLELDVQRSGATIALDYFSIRLAREKASGHRSLGVKLGMSNDQSAVCKGPPAKKRRRGIDTQLAKKEEKVEACETSGATGYGAFLGEDAAGSRLLRFFRFIEDSDLYRFWLSGSREFQAGFANLRIDFDVRTNPGVFAALRTVDIDAVIAAGKSSLEGDGKKITEALCQAFVVSVPAVGVRCLGVRTSHPELRSSMGHALAERSKREGLDGLGVIAYPTPELDGKGYIKVSVRGLEDANTLVLTEKFGGGGHKGASSCNVLKCTFESWCEDAEETTTKGGGDGKATRLAGPQAS